MPEPVVCRTALPTVIDPRWAGVDMIALSLVPGLPRVELFSILHGVRPPGADTVQEDADSPWLPGLAPPGEIEPAVQVAATDALEDLLATLGCRDAKAVASAGRQEAADAVAKARGKGIDVLAWLGPRYPSLVAQIFDPPLAIWVRGCADVLTQPSIAIVGSRAASPYGEETAARLASDLSRRGIVIVSGLARGIDAAAHRGALGAGGRTVAVLGCGPDVVYPPEHGELMDEVARSGAVISEFAPRMPPLPHNFPRRNRIISALSLGVVVVEARQRSGALITADCALEQGREVMAVPGSVLGERHRGSHALLKAGAALIETAEDVLAAVGLAPQPGQASVGSPADPLLARMDAGEAYDLDALSGASGCDAATLLPRLLELELQGLIRRVAGSRFVRPAGNVLR